MPKNYTIRAWEYLQNHRRQIVVFIICLAVSALLWLTIILNRYYVHGIWFKVVLAETDNNQQLIPLQNDTIILDIKAQGYQLLFNKITMARNRSLVLRKNNLRKSRQPELLFITSRSLLGTIASKFPVSAELIHIRPDTLFFRIETADSAATQETTPDSLSSVSGSYGDGFDTQNIINETFPANIQTDTGSARKSHLHQKTGE